MALSHLTSEGGRHIVWVANRRPIQRSKTIVLDFRRDNERHNLLQEILVVLTIMQKYTNFHVTYFSSSASIIGEGGSSKGVAPFAP